MDQRFEDLKSEVQEFDNISQKEFQEIQLALIQAKKDGKISGDMQDELVDELKRLKSLTSSLSHAMEANFDNLYNYAQHFKQLEQERDKIGRDLVVRLENIGLSDNLVAKLEKAEMLDEKLEQDILDRIEEKFRERAREEIAGRGQIFVEKSALNRFLDNAKRNQVGKGIESGGFFYSEIEGNDLYLKKFQPMPNTSEEGTKEDRFDFGGQEVVETAEKIGFSNLVMAHTHPGEDPMEFNHSAMDQNFWNELKQALKDRGIEPRINSEIGVLGVAADGTVWLVAQRISPRIENLFIEVTENGTPVSEERLESLFPQVKRYKAAIIEALVRGREEERWYEYRKS